MATKRYGINIGFIHNSRSILTSAGIHVVDQQNIAGGGDPADTNFGIVFDKANFYNAVSWGSIDTPATLRSLFVQDDDLVYKSIGGVDTELIDADNGDWQELIGGGDTSLHTHSGSGLTQSQLMARLSIGF